MQVSATPAGCPKCGGSGCGCGTAGTGGKPPTLKAGHAQHVREAQLEEEAKKPEHQKKDPQPAFVVQISAEAQALYNASLNASPSSKESPK